MSGPERVMSFCPVYVPGKMKIDRALLSLGKEFSAAVRVANSPDVVVPARTIIAPDGGVVLDAARTYWMRERTQAKSNECASLAMVSWVWHGWKPGLRTFYASSHITEHGRDQETFGEIRRAAVKS